MKNLIIGLAVLGSITVSAVGTKTELADKKISNIQLSKIIQGIIDSKQSKSSSSSFKNSTLTNIRNKHLETAFVNTLDSFNLITLAGKNNSGRFFSHRRIGVAQKFYKRVELDSDVSCDAVITVAPSLNSASAYIHDCEKDGKYYDRGLDISNVYLPTIISEIYE